MTSLVTLSLLLCVDLSTAWGPDGHTVVAHIAQQLLTDDVNKTVQTLLDGYNLNNCSDWNDDYDHSAGGKWSEPLHFINYPGRTCSFDWVQDCANDWCVAGTIVNYTKQVADTSLSLDRRAFALGFIVHMMGDIHQPLHVASSDDKGGNTIKVAGNRFSPQPQHWMNRSATLHSQWDSAIVEQLIYDLEANSALTSSKNGPFKPHYHDWWLISNQVVSKLSGDWKSDKIQWETPVATTNDDASFRAGLKVVADETAAAGCKYAYVDETGSPVKTGDVLSQEYYQRVKPIVWQQLAKGGVRLAQVLNSALKSSTAELVVV